METIFDFVKSQEVKYENGVELADGWTWSMKEHVNQTFLYLNSQFTDQNDNRDLRPFKNIVLPLLNIQYRLDGFDVKDVELYVDNPEDYYKSLIIRKYHDLWSRENGIDTFIDDMTESYATYGGVLVRKTKKSRPEVIDLRSLAFCNQTDILNNPFAIKHEMSFSQLRKEAKIRGWGKEGADITVEELIELVKKNDKDCIDIYEVHGSMPKEWLNDEEVYDESEMDVNQVQIVAFYQSEFNGRQGVCLFKKEMPELPFKFLARDKIYGRALGRGGVEELFEDQIWTNWNEVKVTEMLDSASKTLFKSDDPTFKSRNNIANAQNNEVFSLQEGRDLAQIDTYPRNLPVFNNAVDRFFQHAQLLGGGPDPLMGEAPTSGTPFKLYEAQQVEGKGMHKYRQGKLAVFMDELYRDWILPQLAKDITEEKTFMAELSPEEMQMVVDRVLVNETNKMIKKMILSFQDIDPDFLSLYQEQIVKDIQKKGNKRFFQILKDEMKDVSISVLTNIAGKQKNLALMTDKLVNVIRQFIATPQLRQDPEMIKLLNTILESSGLSPLMPGFSPVAAQAPQQQQGGGQTGGLQGLSQAVNAGAEAQQQ
jgi:hypothetical protein